MRGRRLSSFVVSLLDGENESLRLVGAGAAACFELNSFQILNVTVASLFKQNYSVMKSRCLTPFTSLPQTYHR